MPSRAGDRGGSTRAGNCFIPAIAAFGINPGTGCRHVRGGRKKGDAAQTGENSGGCDADQTNNTNDEVHKA